MGDEIKILQGKYNYLSQNKIYSEENFKVFKEDGKNANFLFESEVLSRVKTGEFLKIYVKYKVTRNFDPMEISITRQMGDKESIESFTVDEKTKNYHYKFVGTESTQTFDKIFASRPHVATPAFLTSMMMTNQKRLDPVQRTAYNVITSQNFWNYDSPFEEKVIYAELQSLEPKEIEINKKEVKATHCKLLQDNMGTHSEDGHDVFLSKHFNIPYLAIFSPELHIQVDHLKSYEANMSQF